MIAFVVGLLNYALIISGLPTNIKHFIFYFPVLRTSTTKNKTFDFVVYTGIVVLRVKGTVYFG
jgi:hypothetical protein